MIFRKLFIFLLIVTTPFKYACAQFALDIEGNYIFSVPYNTVRIPSDGGTKIDIANDLSRESTFTYRIRANYSIKNRHVLSLLAAPLSIKSAGAFDKPVVYDDAVFAPGQQIHASYTFNSFRLTYRYMFVWKDRLKIGAGISGKIRDADITLKSESTKASFSNVGFVPLINFYFEWKPLDRLAFITEGDAFGSAQGRAEDIFAGIAYTASQSAKIKAGYRVLEGGADVKDNYNFSFINYLAVGAIITFNKKP